jgi:hypothetical protein
MTCAICSGPDASPNPKPLNGLPKGVVACQGCVQAVKARQVGVVVRADGSLSITDGRGIDLSTPDEPQAAQLPLFREVGA